MQKFFTPLLIAVLACSAQALQAQDIIVNSVTTPVSACGYSSPQPVTVTFKSNGGDWYGGFPVSYDYTYNGTPFTGGGDYYGDDLISGVVSPTFEFTDYIDVSQPGTYVITITIPPQPGESNPNPSTLTHTFTNYGFPISVNNGTPYFEDFEGPTTWTPKGTNSSWALGNPTSKPTINTAYAGVNSWVTNLTGPYNNNELSFVESPCFDFTGLNFPEIEMAIWWNAQSGSDGAKLQSSIDAGLTWQNVGQFGDTINWYNDNSIVGLNSPQHGWTGTGTSSSGGWVIAKHDLTGLGGQSSVKLRMVFGSNGFTNGPGFAFDNVAIREKMQYDAVLLNYRPWSQGCGLGTAEHITINFFNNGTEPITSGDMILAYTLGTNPEVTETYSGPAVAPYTFGSYTFNATENLSVGQAFNISMALLLTNDQNGTNNIKNAIIFNSVVDAPPTLPYSILFEDGGATLNLFSVSDTTRSRVLVNTAHSYEGTYAMVLDGSTEPLGWSEYDALTNPFGPNSNPLNFSKAVLCVRIPDSLATMKLSFYLKQLYYQSFLNTNFRLTVNGTPIPFTRDGVVFNPNGNQKALRPPVTPNATTNQWQHIEADIHPYIDLNDTTQVAVQIGFESSVRMTYDAINATTGTANIIDSIRVETTKVIISGTEDLLNQQLSVYPNPNNGQFMVDLSQAAQGAYTFEVTDLTGKLITRETARLEGQPSVTINLADQPKGVYILKVSSDKNVATRKIVVQ